MDSNALTDTKKSTCTVSLRAKELPEVGVSLGLGGIAIGIDLGIGIDVVPGIALSLGLGIDLGILGMGRDSFMSTTTASDVRKVLATDAACSKQHLTTCTIFYLTQSEN